MRALPLAARIVLRAPAKFGHVPEGRGQENRQLDKVLEEADELADALHDGDADHACREAWDVVQAVEGILRRCPDHVVERARADVMLRCSRRGDYGEIEDIE